MHTISKWHKFSINTFQCAKSYFCHLRGFTWSVIQIWPHVLAFLLLLVMGCYIIINLFFSDFFIFFLLKEYLNSVSVWCRLRRFPSNQVNSDFVKNMRAAWFCLHMNHRFAHAALCYFSPLCFASPPVNMSKKKNSYWFPIASPCSAVGHYLEC